MSAPGFVSPAMLVVEFHKIHATAVIGSELIRWHFFQAAISGCPSIPLKERADPDKVGLYPLRVAVRSPSTTLRFARFVRG